MLVPRLQVCLSFSSSIPSGSESFGVMQIQRASFASEHDFCLTAVISSVALSVAVVGDVGSGSKTGSLCLSKVHMMMQQKHLGSSSFPPDEMRRSSHQCAAFFNSFFMSTDAPALSVHLVKKSSHAVVSSMNSSVVRCTELFFRWSLNETLFVSLCIMQMSMTLIVIATHKAEPS